MAINIKINGDMVIFKYYTVTWDHRWWTYFNSFTVFCQLCESNLDFTEAVAYFKKEVTSSSHKPASFKYFSLWPKMVNDAEEVNRQRTLKM